MLFRAAVDLYVAVDCVSRLVGHTLVVPRLESLHLVVFPAVLKLTLAVRALAARLSFLLRFPVLKRPPCFPVCPRSALCPGLLQQSLSLFRWDWTMVRAPYSFVSALEQSGLFPRSPTLPCGWLEEPPLPPTALLVPHFRSPRLPISTSCMRCRFALLLPSPPVVPTLLSPLSSRKRLCPPHTDLEIRQCLPEHARH